MKEKTLVIKLDEILPFLSPLKNGEEKKRPNETMRRELLGESALWGYSDTPLSLCLGYGEGTLSLEGVAHKVLKNGNDYIIEEDTLVERSVDFELFRSFSLLRAQFLGLALCNTKKLPYVTLRLLVYAEGRVEMEEFFFEKEALSKI